MTLKRTGSAIAAAAALGLVLTGCQQQGANKDQKVDDTKGAEQAAALPSTGWKTGTAKEGGKLTLAITDLPSNFNYFQADGAEVNTNRLLAPLGIGACVVFGADGTAKPDPNYLESAKLVSNDPQIVEVKFNKKAVWEDGTPIKAQDLVDFWKANNGKDEAFQTASTQGWEQMSSVEATDEFTAKITYAEKNAEWMGYICPGIPSSISTDSKKFNEGYADKGIPSSGPYKIDKVDTQGKVVTLVRNDKWWGEKGKLDQIVFKAVSQGSQAQAFANGEIDTVEIGTSGDTYKTVKGSDKGEIQKSSGLQWTHLTLNTERPGLNDPAVRKAIGHLVNRDLIAQAAIGPVEAPVIRQNSFMFMPGQKGYQPNGEAVFKTDPAAATKALEDAGWKKGSDNIYAKDGQKLDFKVVIPAGTKSNEMRATQVMKDLTAAGIKVEMQSVPSDAYFKDYVNKHNFDMVTFTWEGTPFPILSGANIFMPGSKQNYTGLNDPKIAEQVKAAIGEFDDTKRAGLVNDLDKTLMQHEVLMPFYVTPFVWGVKKGLVNYGPSQFETADWTKVGFSG